MKKMKKFKHHDIITGSRKKVLKSNRSLYITQKKLPLQYNTVPTFIQTYCMFEASKEK